MADRKTLTTPQGEAKRLSTLDADAIRDMLRHGKVRFVVEDFVHSQQWQAEERYFEFWKSEVQTHLADPDARIFLDDWPNGYAYFASLWDDGGSPIILLRQVH